MKIFTLRIVALIPLVFFAAALFAEEPKAAPSEAPVKIWDAGAHNAFTDLLRFGDYFYCAFREGSGHIPGKKTGDGDGTVRIIRSKTGEKWESAALLKKPTFDLRDSKLSVTPDGRIMVTMGGSVYVEQKLIRRVPQVSFSDKNGENFSEPQDMVIDESMKSNFDWLWRVTWHEGIGYGVNYQFDSIDEPDWRLWLMKTSDGIHYEKVSQLAVDCRPNEATVRFAPDGTMSILVRRESGNCFAWFGRAAAPFTDWRWFDTGESLGGPNFIYLPDGSIFAGGRVRGKTGLGRITTDGKFQSLETLPSAGDNSYPGFCLVGNTLWISYYSSHDGKTSVWLTRRTLDEIARAMKAL